MKTSNPFPVGRAAMALTIALAAVPSLAASNGLCGPEACTLYIEMGISEIRTTRVTYELDEQGGKALWSDSTGRWLSDLGGVGWQPIAGDYDNDGIDDIAVYRDGVFMVQRGNGSHFTEFPTQTYSVPDTFRWDDSTMPVSGNWDGLGGDDLGIFTNGMFALFPTIDDLTQVHRVSFRNLPRDLQLDVAPFPVTGPMDNNEQNIDLVGVYFDQTVKYALGVNAEPDAAAPVQYALTTVEGVAVSPVAYARPHIFKTENVPTRFAFVIPPDQPPIDFQTICDTDTSGYTCARVDISRPDDDEVIVIPPSPF